MSPELVELVLGIGAIVMGAGGVAAHQYRKRNGKSLPPPPDRTVVQVQPDASPADDTSRLAALVQAAPKGEVEQLIHLMRESLEQKPATQGDVQRAIAEWGGKVRADINGHFRTTDAVATEARRRAVSVEQIVLDLPCVRDASPTCPDDHDVVNVPVPVKQ